MRGDVKLQYCKIGDEIRHVSDFAQFAPKQRPPVFCCECDQPLTLKLGSSGKIAHHAAHKSDNKFCVLTNPESALHFNTKMYIFSQLKNGGNLFLKQFCAGWMLPYSGSGQSEIRRHCFSRKFNKHLWLKNWDDVRVEKTIETVRPDIVIYRDGKPVAAVEVFVTHAVDESKKLLFHEMGVQWIEVNAEDCLFDEDFAEYAGNDDEYSWTIDRPLPYRNGFPTPETWTCQRCLAAPEGFMERQAEADEKERLDRLNKLSEKREQEAKLRRYTNKFDNKVLYAKAILFLRGLAESEYVELFVIQRDSSEPPYKPEELYLKIGKYGGKILISEEPVKDNSRDEIKQFYRDWLLVKSRGARQVVHLTNWINESEFDKFTANYTRCLVPECRGLDKS